MMPGDDVYGQLTVSNGGTGDLRYGSFSFGVDVPVPGDTTGERLDPKSASYAKAQREGVKPKGRSSPFNLVSVASLVALQRGDNVVIPLLGDEQVTGKVNLVQRDESGWVRGSLCQIERDRVITTGDTRWKTWKCAGGQNYSSCARKRSCRWTMNMGNRRIAG
jgi:hypothetical protein